MTDTIEVGQYRRWTAQRYMSSWNCMAKIISVKEGEDGKKYSVFTYDTFSIAEEISETTLLKESKKVTKEEFLDYVSKEITKAEETIIKGKEMKRQGKLAKKKFKVLYTDLEDMK